MPKIISFFFFFCFSFSDFGSVCAVWHGLFVFTVCILCQQWMSPSSFRFPCALCSTNFAWMRNGNWYAVDWHGVTLCCNTERLSSTNVYSNFRCIFEMIKLPPLPQQQQQQHRHLDSDSRRRHSSDEEKVLSQGKNWMEFRVKMNCDWHHTHEQINVFLTKCLVNDGWLDAPGVFCIQFSLDVAGVSVVVIVVIAVV